MEKLTTIYLRFDYDVRPIEDKIIDTIKESISLGLKEVRIFGNPVKYIDFFYRIIKTVEDLGINLSFDLEQSFITEQFIDYMNKLKVGKDFAVNIGSDLEIKDEKLYKGLIGNVLVNYGNYLLLDDIIPLFLTKYGFRLLKLNTSIKDLGSIKLYLSFVEKVKKFHDLFPDRIYSAIPWCLLDEGSLRVSRTICNFDSTVGIFLDGKVTVCGVSRHFIQLESSLLDRSIKDILMNDSSLKMLESLIPNKLIGVCKKCIFKKYCANLCPAQIFNETGLLQNSHRDCQILYDNGVFPTNCLIE